MKPDKQFIVSEQLAKHLTEVYFGGNWTTVNLRDTLKDVSCEEALKQIGSLNSIATIVYHLQYYVQAVTKVLHGEALNSKDELSFLHPPFQSENDWNTFLENCWKEAEEFTVLIRQLEDQKMWEYFTAEKYGNYFRNLAGIIEHHHYHLGQIVIIKKMIRETSLIN